LYFQGNEAVCVNEKKATFSGKVGFVLAAAGAAVGLGNIWRFPYLAAKYGGGVFLFVYLILALTFGFTLMICEIAIGRRTGKSAMEAFRALDRRFAFLGYGSLIIPFLILPYYSVVGGWVIKFFAAYLVGDGSRMGEGSYFAAYVQGIWEPLLFFSVFLAVTAVVVLMGVQKGIEKLSKIMMPSLLAFMLFITVYILFTVDGALSGAMYYIKPDFSKLSLMTVVAAMGQLFYSMSLAMGVIITYGSYMKKNINIERSARQIEIFDTGIAFLSGLMIVPAVFAFSGGQAAHATEGGKGLMFVTLPRVFATMPGGSFVGAAFFLCVFFAALTSAVSMMETIVSGLCEKTAKGRAFCCALTVGLTVILGIFPTLGFSLLSDVRLLGLDILDFFDFLSNNLVIPLVALGTCLLIGYVKGTETVSREIELSGPFRSKRLFSVMIRYIAPPFIVLILVSSFLDALDVISI